VQLVASAVAPPIVMALPGARGVHMCPLETQPLVQHLRFNTKVLFSINTDSSASLRDAEQLGACDWGQNRFQVCRVSVSICFILADCVEGQTKTSTIFRQQCLGLKHFIFSVSTWPNRFFRSCGTSQSIPIPDMRF
jgi:hypothetical protein